MVDQWQHGYLYAVAPDSDVLAHAPEAYLCVDTPAGTRFLYSPHLAPAGNGPHETDPTTIELATNQGFALFPANILALWEDRDNAILSIARAEGLLPAEEGPLGDAEAVLRMTHPAGRIANALHASDQWPNSTLYIHTTPHNTFDSMTVVLRTKNPYQARSLLIMLGAQRDDIADITGIEA